MDKLLEFLSNKIIISIITIIFTLIVLKIISIIFKRHDEKKEIHIKFLKSFIQAFVIIIAIFKIGNEIPSFKAFSTTILTSSSLLVVVIGFAFQEGLSTIIHGIIISVFHPFNIGDRIRIEEKNITGIVENITLRHTVIRNLSTSAFIEIPNDIMDKAIIENFHSGDEEIHTNFLDVTISYEDDIEKAIELITKAIEEHPLTIDRRTEEDISNNVPYVNVLLREFGASGIDLRANAVVTKTVNDNFNACSDIKKRLLKDFAENNITIPYNHNHLCGEVNVNIPYNNLQGKLDISSKENEEDEFF